MRCIYLVIILLVAVPCYPATYYVDADASDDTGTGAVGDPWKYIPGTSDSTNDGDVSAGDTVYVDCDSTFTITDNAVTFSTWGPIAGVTYDGSTWAQDGTCDTNTYDMAMIEYMGDTGNDLQAALTFYDDNAVYETVVYGFEIDGNWRDACGILICGITKDVHVDTGWKRIENCVVHHFDSEGYRYGLRAYPANDLGIGDADLTKDIRYLRIYYNTFFHIARTGIGIYPLDNSPATARDVTIRGNTVYDIGYQEDYTGCGQLLGQNIFAKGNMYDIVIENNYMYDGAAGGNTFLLSASGGTHNIIVRHNIFNCSIDTSFGPCVRFSDTTAPTSREVQFYGNIIYNGGQDDTCDPTSYRGLDFNSILTTGDFYIYNNTLYEAHMNIPAGDFSTLEVKNNIVYGTGSGITISETGSHVDVSNNVTANPTFKNTSNLPDGWTGTYGTDMTPNNDGLSVTGSNVVDQGIDLGSSYDSSINSVDRGSVWDIGAYENSEEIPANAIQGMQISNLNVTNNLIAWHRTDGLR